MARSRKIKKTHEGRQTSDGAGVSLTRVFGYYETPEYDPFLLLDFFDSRNPKDYIQGFPWHPHRGIETVTYLIGGRVEHEDSMGNKGIINDGDCQWMTAGSGIIHQEMPLESRHMYGVQLWVNLPADKKMTRPAYRDIKNYEVQSVESEKAIVKVIAGSYGNVTGPVKGIAANPTFMDVEVMPYETFHYEMDPELNIVVFVIEGKGFFDRAKEDFVSKGTVATFEDGDSLDVVASSEGVRFLYFSGKRLEEPIAWRGPIVMNTKEELDKAYDELNRGVFIRTRPDNQD